MVQYVFLHFTVPVFNHGSLIVQHCDVSYKYIAGVISKTHLSNNNKLKKKTLTICSGRSAHAPSHSMYTYSKMAARSERQTQMDTMYLMGALEEIDVIKNRWTES